MKCPVCEPAGERSTVHPPQYSTTTAMAYGGPFYDEDGNLHRHDPNVRSSEPWYCSLGHQWHPAKKPCPSCDYHEQPLEIIRGEQSA